MRQLFRAIFQVVRSVIAFAAAIFLIAIFRLELRAARRAFLFLKNFHFRIPPTVVFARLPILPAPLALLAFDMP